MKPVDRQLWTMRAAALQWLRYGRMCPLVALERGPVAGNPDALGMTKDRRMVEIEIKRSRGDFRADRAKAKHRQGWNPVAQFYWFVPAEMAEWARTQLRDGEGLLVLGNGQSIGNIPEAVVLVPARARKDAVRLCARGMREMALAQGGTLVAVAGLLGRHALDFITTGEAP